MEANGRTMPQWSYNEVRAIAETKSAELQRMAEASNNGSAERSWLTRFVGAMRRLLGRRKNTNGS